jgi:hypothetical protein
MYLLCNFFPAKRDSFMANILWLLAGRSQLTTHSLFCSMTIEAAHVAFAAAFFTL